MIAKWPVKQPIKHSCGLIIALRNFLNKRDARRHSYRFKQV